MMHGRKNIKFLYSVSQLNIKDKMRCTEKRQMYIVTGLVYLSLLAVTFNYAIKRNTKPPFWLRYR